MRQVWLLFGCKKASGCPWVEGVFIDKVLCELHVRLLNDPDRPDAADYHYWIQEKAITRN